MPFLGTFLVGSDFPDDFLEIRPRFVAQASPDLMILLSQPLEY